MTLDQISTQMEQAIYKEGAYAEITFCRADMFSVACDTPAALETAMSTLAKVPNAKLDSVDHDDECGSFAYYSF